MRDFFQKLKIKLCGKNEVDWIKEVGLGSGFSWVVARGGCCASEEGKKAGKIIKHKFALKMWYEQEDHQKGKQTEASE